MGPCLFITNKKELAAANPGIGQTRQAGAGGPVDSIQAEHDHDPDHPKCCKKFIKPSNGPFQG